jgi:transcriptional regulator with XRE-family HTH domain
MPFENFYLVNALDVIISNLNRLVQEGPGSGALADSIGMSRGLLNDYLKGRKAPGIEQIEKIAKGLGTNLSKLLAGERPAEPAPAPESDTDQRLEAVRLLLNTDSETLDNILLILRGSLPAAKKDSKSSAS